MKRMNACLLVYALFMFIATIFCDVLDYDTAPAVTNNDDVSAFKNTETLETQNKDSSNNALEAEFRHHPGHHVEHINNEPSHVFDPSHASFPSGSFNESPEPWQPSNIDSPTTNHFPTYLKQSNPAHPSFKAGNLKIVVSDSTDQ